MNIKQVDLSTLPRYNNSTKIDWLKCIGYELPFIYNEYTGIIKIIDVKHSQNSLVLLDLQYNSDFFNSVPSRYIKNANLGTIVGSKSSDFKTYIGQHFKDSNRDIIIKDQRRGLKKSNQNYTIREVLIYCNKCKENTWMAEERILPPRNCRCNKCRYIPSENDQNNIITTAPWMIKYFVGGIEEAKKYSISSHKKPDLICPFCGAIRHNEVSVDTLYHNYSIGCKCNFNNSHYYPESLFRVLLQELHINFQQELSHRHFSWITSYFYDFYLFLSNTIIELQGKQHFIEGTGYYKNTLAETQENDQEKKDLALLNNCKYIVIDCRYSNLNFIKKNILESDLRLYKEFDFSKIKWNEIHEQALNSIKKEILDYCKSHPYESIREIADRFRVSRDTVKTIEVNASIYDINKEKILGKKKELATKEANSKNDYEIICQIKIDYPEITTQEIAEITNHSRTTIRNVLKKNGLYNYENEKKNKALKIHNANQHKYENNTKIITSFKQNNNNISAREVERLTSFSHSYILKIWRENNLI